MKHSIRLPNVLLVLVCLSIEACSTLDVNSDYVLDPARNEGLAVVSLSFEGLHSSENPVWEYRRSDGSGRKTILTQSPSHPLDFVSPSGRLILIALPPGRYEFYQCSISRPRGGGPTWTMGANGIASNSNPWNSGFNAPVYDRYEAKPFSMSFEIASGRATYVGNLHLVWRELGARGFIKKQSRLDRDLEVLKSHFPNVDLNSLIDQSSSQ